MTSATIVNRDDTWPIVVTTIHGTEHSDDAIDQVVNTWFTWRQRGPHVLVVDTTRGYAGASARQRAHLARRVRQLLQDTDPEENKHQQVALILVYDNMVVRGLVTGLLWLVPTKVSPRMVGSMHDAVEMAVAELRKVGVSVPSSAVLRVQTGTAAAK